MATITRTRDARPMGAGAATDVDAAKAAAGFRLTACPGTRNAITWRDGRQEVVTDARLRKLQAAHSWATDF